MNNIKLKDSAELHAFFLAQLFFGLALVAKDIKEKEKNENE